MTVEEIAGMSNRVKRFMSLYSGIVTVVIRNEAPLMYAGDSPSHRTVRLTLTDAQMGLLGLSKEETLSQSIFEPNHEQDWMSGRGPVESRSGKCFVE